jgi:acetyl esterase/lipase
MKTSVLVASAIALLAGVDVEAAVWEPAPGHTQMPIWPGEAPLAQSVEGPETLAVVNNLIAGKPWTAAMRVARPTMTVYSPATRNTGVAVIVFPGGGYKTLAIDLEGTEICDWLVDRGITAILLKYRVPDSGPHWDADVRHHVDPKTPMALADAQRTVGLVRARARDLHVDPHKIGVLGFSAGGHLVANVSTHFDRRAYPAVDATDTVSCRPDFAVAIYPGHMREHTTHEFELNSTLPVSGRTPATFLLQAVTDPVDPVENSLVYYIALKKARVPVELHLYGKGGHAFGLRRTQDPVTRWPELVESWLWSIGILAE